MLISGDAELIITPKNKKILIDGGEKENILLEYLLDRQIMKLDYIMISHFDSDHCYNLIQIIENLRVKNLIISKQIEETELFNEIINLCKKHKVKVIIIEAGDEIQIEKKIKFKILWPTNKINSNSSINNHSIVAKLEYNNFSMLFTGDIERPSEEEIIKIYGEETVKSTILKVAHHGSNTSTTQEFLNKVSPQIALIGVRQRKQIWTS